MENLSMRNIFLWYESAMNTEYLKDSLLPIIAILFFAWRFFRFKKIRKQIPTLLQNGAQLVDVRSASEYAYGNNPLSKNIPLNQLSQRAQELDANKAVLICCASGTRSGMAKAVLKKHGFKNVMNAGPWTNTL